MQRIKLERVELVEELALHIMHIAQNSIHYGCKQMQIRIKVSSEKGILEILIADNGSGTDDEMLVEAINPIYRSRKRRKTVRGLSLLKNAAEKSGGKLTVKANKGKGKIVTATFQVEHLNRPLLGDVAKVISLMAYCNPQTDFNLRLINDNDLFNFYTNDAKKFHGEKAQDNMGIVNFMENNIQAGFHKIFRGKLPETVGLK